MLKIYTLWICENSVQEPYGYVIPGRPSQIELDECLECWTLRRDNTLIYALSWTEVATEKTAVRIAASWAAGDYIVVQL